MSFYTGIGSRSTPDHILGFMYRIATHLDQHGYRLRSGAADGADTAFQRGASGNADVYLPWPSFQRSTKNVLSGSYISASEHPLADRALELVSQVHPAWHRCTPGARKLHARNAFQVLGDDLATPSSFCVLWAQPRGTQAVQGGTNTAFQLCLLHDVPVFNLFFADVRERIEAWLNDEG